MSEHGDVGYLTFDQFDRFRRAVHQWAKFDGDAIERRRKAGPWLPVKENTPHTEGNED